MANTQPPTDTIDPAAKPEVPELQGKFEALDAALNAELVERRSEIRALILGLISETSMFLLGQPGVAKSMLADRLAKYVSDVNYFNILMTRFTEPPELFGPQSLKGLKEDRFVRKIEGYLPTSDYAMIDEIWKANSSILNALLWALNERKYRHDDQIIGIPLKFLICASNELPQDESLAALYDRIMFRFVVNPVRDQSNFIRMLSTNRPENPDPIMSWADVRKAQDEAAQVVVPSAVLEGLADLRKKLREEGIEPSERRFVQSLKIVRAAAWFDECDVADIEHLRPLEHVLWMQPDQQPKVSELVLAKANPLETEANALLQNLAKLEGQLNNLKSDDERHRIGNEINGKLRRCKGDLDALRKRAGTSRRRSERIDEVQERLASLTDRVLVEVFDFSPEDAKKIDKG